MAVTMKQIDAARDLAQYWLEQKRSNDKARWPVGSVTADFNAQNNLDKARKEVERLLAIWEKQGFREVPEQDPIDKPQVSPMCNCYPNAMHPKGVGAMCFNTGDAVKDLDLLFNNTNALNSRTDREWYEKVYRMWKLNYIKKVQHKSIFDGLSRLSVADPEGYIDNLTQVTIKNVGKEASKGCDISVTTQPTTGLTGWRPNITLKDTVITASLLVLTNKGVK